MKIIKILLLTLFVTNLAYSVIPTYQLNVKNFNYITSNCLEFDIFLKHTNPSESTFDYSMGQYVFNFNPNFANGGTLVYSFTPNTPVSDLPAFDRPTQPTVFYNQLRLITNRPSEGFIISGTANNGEGTLIARMRLRTTATSFAGDLTNLNLSWRNSISGGLFTKIASNIDFEIGILIKNITDFTGHSVIGNVGNNINIISGTVFRDYNNNGIKDSGEPPYSNAFLTLNSGLGFTSSDIYGNYYMGCGLGTYSVNIQNLPLYHSSNPAMNTADFTNYGLTDAGNNFALVGIPGINDLRITLTPHRVSVPGFDVGYYLSYQNIGTTTQSGDIEMIYDNHYTYLPALTNPPHAAHNSTAHTITWNYSNLLPGEKRNIVLRFNLPADVAIGTQLSSISTVYPVSGDYAPHDNEYICNQIVRGSYDPNDITVEPDGKITPEQAANEDSLTYTIRFQNTGTYPAFTVRIVDTLSSKLNFPTIEAVSSSHNFTYTVSEAGIAEFTFENILLPDSNTNEPASHGFVKYRIKPKNNLAIGDTIKNTAYIFFDFNTPIVTNTAITPIGYSNVLLDLSWRFEAMYPTHDTISVYLRSSSAPYSLVDSGKGNPDTCSICPGFFRKSIEFNNAVSGSSYYIVVKHRNSIETWSANPVTFSGGTTAYNFTASVSQAYGNNMILAGGVASFYTGDVNQDGVVDAADAALIDNDAYNFVTGYVNTDLNGNGFADATDAAFVDNNGYNLVIVLRP